MQSRRRLPPQPVTSGPCAPIFCWTVSRARPNGIPRTAALSVAEEQKFRVVRTTASRLPDNSTSIHDPIARPILHSSEVGRMYVPFPCAPVYLPSVHSGWLLHYVRRERVDSCRRYTSLFVGMELWAWAVEAGQRHPGRSLPVHDRASFTVNLARVTTKTDF